MARSARHLIKYQFVPNHANLILLTQLGFETRNLDIDHYYWNFYTTDMFGNGIPTTLVVNKLTNILAYIDSHHTINDVFDDAKIGETMSRKIQQLIDNKLIYVIHKQTKTKSRRK